MVNASVRRTQKLAFVGAIPGFLVSPKQLRPTGGEAFPDRTRLGPAGQLVPPTWMLQRVTLSLRASSASPPPGFSLPPSCMLTPKERLGGFVRQHKNIVLTCSDGTLTHICKQPWCAYAINEFLTNVSLRRVQRCVYEVALRTQCKQLTLDVNVVGQRLVFTGAG